MRAPVPPGGCRRSRCWAPWAEPEAKAEEQQGPGCHSRGAANLLMSAFVPRRPLGARGRDATDTPGRGRGSWRVVLTPLAPARCSGGCPRAGHSRLGTRPGGSRRPLRAIQVHRDRHALRRNAANAPGHRTDPRSSGREPGTLTGSLGRPQRSRGCRRRGTRRSVRAGADAAWKSGNSARHGPHHDAQTLITTGVPRSVRNSLLNAVRPPERSWLRLWCSLIRTGEEPAYAARSAAGDSARLFG